MSKFTKLTLLTTIRKRFTFDHFLLIFLTSKHMKTTQLKKSSKMAKWDLLFWDKSLPSDTCVLWKRFIGSILLLPFTWFGVIWHAIFRNRGSEVVGVWNKMGTTLAFSFGPVIFGIPWFPEKGNHSFFSVWSMGWVSIVIVLIAIVIIGLACMGIGELRDNWREKQSEKRRKQTGAGTHVSSAPTAIGEALESIKEKTCKKIEWI